MRRVTMLCTLAILAAGCSNDTGVQQLAPEPQPQPTAPAPIDYGKYWQDQMLYNIGSYGP
ncbi:hypothetical protein FHP25_19160 [Vineibacter terrae]|uniref:Uncharacterized protein n=1 Tax=Vineibacter terrae TaxID=2586908 RepID=A0A5C8PJF8_9HYPH|nr:hypothetical protein [Vineibacter terrae]TXL73780.1 hypothetical protein FHP25_19160 [Vineibacter terrae]